ncbi:Oligopeptide transporter 8 [Beauveria bassiana]|uniref:Oligopeptide transporter 8 n=1 Tax=Beauveria bassiana TaxID=176275 RepID=A0A2N6NZN8_BEABA|nr:Oligopeptide transporter 8 [Beauveria bassiana]
MARTSGEKHPDRVTESDATVIAAEADAPIAPLQAGSDKEDAFQVDLESKDTNSDKTRLYTITNENGQEESISEDDPRISSIPSYVRRVVNLTDDPTEPTITFRYFLLTILFVAPGAFLSQMSHYRTTSAPYSIYPSNADGEQVFFVQIASNYLGKWLAQVLPAWEVKIPFTKKSFNLNPGPFSTKEHVLVTISAASGATYK